MKTHIFVNKIRAATICHGLQFGSGPLAGLGTGKPGFRLDRNKEGKEYNGTTHEKVMESYLTLKNKGHKAFCDFYQENTREGERKPPRRQYYASRKEEMERLASEYTISYELVDSEDGIVDENALDYVMEIGMLVKVYQVGLIDERMLVKIKDDTSKRYSTHYSFLE